MKSILYIFDFYPSKDSRFHFRWSHCLFGCWLGWLPLFLSIDFRLPWYSKRHNVVARSSAEAEYRGVANAVAETCWLRNLLRELHTPPAKVIIVYCDKISSVYMTANLVQHQCTKHIEIDLHFVRDLVALGQVRFLHVPSRSQYADIVTKGLPSTLLNDFRSNLNVWISPPDKIARVVRMYMCISIADSYYCFWSICTWPLKTHYCIFILISLWIEYHIEFSYSNNDGIKCESSLVADGWYYYRKESWLLLGIYKKDQVFFLLF